MLASKLLAGFQSPIHQLFPIFTSSLLFLVHTADTDKTRLSCHVGVGVRGVNWTGDKSRLSATENFWTVLSRNAVWTESCLVLTQFPIRNVVTYCDVIFENWVKTSSQTRSHRRQDWTKLFSLQYIEDYWKLSATVTNSVHTANKTRQDSLVLSVWTRQYSYIFPLKQNTTVKPLSCSPRHGNKATNSNSSVPHYIHWTTENKSNGNNEYKKHRKSLVQRQSYSCKRSCTSFMAHSVCRSELDQ